MLGRLRLGRPSPAMMVALLALFAALGGVAAAAFVSSGNVVKACVSKDGAVKVVDEAASSCPGSQVLVRLAGVDGAGKVANADKLDGNDSSAFLTSSSSIDAATLDGKDSSDFLGASAKAADADKLDGFDSSDFLGASAKAADADKLDGFDSSDYLGASAKAADADTLDGNVDTTVASTQGGIHLDGPNQSEQITVSCPSDGIALRGSHEEFLFFGVIPAGQESYSRSSYTVTWNYDGNIAIFDSELQVRCLTGTAP